MPMRFAELLVMVLHPIGPGRGTPHGPPVQRNVVRLLGGQEFLPMRMLLEDREHRLALLG